MPSKTHEGLVDLFRARPELAVTLLRDVLHVPVPEHAEVRIEAADLSSFKPKERRADLVILLVNGKPVLGIVVEVQLAKKPSKRWTWPAYITHLRERLRCPVCLLVIAPDARVARWCAKPIETGHPGFTLKPNVIGPNRVPVVTDPEVARKDPETAVLSVVAHGQGEQGFEVALALVKAADALDDDRQDLYVDMVYVSVSEAVRRKLEAMMMSGYQFQSDFAKKHFGRGRKEGEAEGRKEGEAEGRAASVITVLEARGIRVTKVARQRILGSADVAELDRWLRRAAVVAKAAELFADEPAR